MKNLRIAVIPADRTNDIDQSSDVDMILGAPGILLYPLTDFFQAQNDDMLPESYWTFLIDIDRRLNFTGCNIPGIHEEDKEKLLIERLVLDLDDFVTCSGENVWPDEESVEESKSLLGDIKKLGKYRTFPIYSQQTPEQKQEIQELLKLKFSV